MEAAPDAEVEEDVEIADTLPQSFDEYVPPPGGGGGAGNDFVAFDTKPEIVNFVNPEYSEFAREAGLEGLVMVDVLVGTNGRVKATRISKSVHPVLDQAAIQAAQRRPSRRASSATSRSRSGSPCRTISRCSRPIGRRSESTGRRLPPEPACAFLCGVRASSVELCNPSASAA